MPCRKRGRTSLFDNGRRGASAARGEQSSAASRCRTRSRAGRAGYRQNLLGKRVDYSGRSVIVVGPELKLHQCGLPEEMALESSAVHLRAARRARPGRDDQTAKEMVEQQRPGSVGRARRGHSRASGPAQPRASTFHRLGAFRRSSRSSSRARRSASIRWSARRSTPTSTATRSPCISRSRRKRRSRRPC